MNPRGLKKAGGDTALPPNALSLASAETAGSLKEMTSLPQRGKSSTVILQRLPKEYRQTAFYRHQYPHSSVPWGVLAPNWAML